MTIKTLVLGMMQTNCYIVYDEASKEGYVVDPADQAGTIVSEISELGVTVLGILLTHGHYDHISAAAELAKALQVPVMAGSREKELLMDKDMNASRLFRRDCVLEPDRLLYEGDVLTLGDKELAVLETPGHTLGGICFFCDSDDVVFCGDTIFRDSIGRTDFATGNLHHIKESIRTKLFGLKNEVLLLPGHGEPTTVGYEKMNNPYVR